MRSRQPDKIDLRIAEMEAEVVTEIRRLIVQECLGRCKISHPGCSYLESVEICPSIQRIMKEEVSDILREMGEKN